MIFHVDDIRYSYKTIIEHIKMYGHPTSPRGQGTREIMGAQIRIPMLTYTMPTDIKRGLNPAIGAAEALQLIGGQQYPNLMAQIAPNFERFKNGEVFHGSYGERLVAQIPTVIQRLIDDRDTRQAVAMIWDPARDLYIDDRRDLPCTTQMQWLIRDGYLDQIVTMRSNDIWWGTAYDLFQFTQLGIQIAHCVRARPGRVILNASSLHMYDRDITAADALYDSPSFGARTGEMAPYASYLGYTADEHGAPIGSRPWSSVKATAIRILEDPYEFVDSVYPARAWYAQTLVKALAL